MDRETLTFEATVAAGPATVYRAWTDPALLVQWLCTDARLTVQEGGRIYLFWQPDYDVTGRFTELVENKALAFSWHGWGEPAPTEVAVDLTERDRQTHVTVNHHGVGSGAEWTQTRQQIEEGWGATLANLKMMIEKGVDKRIYDRPFMGLVPGGLLNEAEKAALGVEGGLQLAQIFKGSSLEAAGFQVGDVLIRVNDTDIINFPALGAVLADLKVGDVIDVRYARNGTLHDQKVTLGSRPLPDVPAAPADFANRLAEIYERLDAELDELFDGVSNDAAYAQPAEGEWSAAQVVAHLIVTERGTQMGAYQALSGQQRGGFPGNDSEIIDSITAIYPDIRDLLAFWKRTEAETVALVRGLPERFVDCKIDYHNLGLTLLLGLPVHTRSHMPQIQAALAAHG